MVAALHCCVAVGRVRNDNDSAQGFFYKSIRVLRRPSAVLCPHGAWYELRMCAETENGSDSA
jgi:hypothetical protein